MIFSFYLQNDIFMDMKYVWNRFFDCQNDMRDSKR